MHYSSEIREWNNIDAIWYFIGENLASATIDHMISITVFLAALLLFITLFSQTNQTAIVYQEHRATATKCSDLIDNLLLNPGSPNTWGISNDLPVGFGVQDPEFTQYQLSPWSLMRLASSTGDEFFYKEPNATYRETTTGFGSSLYMLHRDLLNYSSALKLLGVNNSYGFQLSLTPIVNVSISETHAQSPLTLEMNVTGPGFPLAGASISYCLILVSLPSGAENYPSYTMINGSDIVTDEEGFASVSFAGVASANQCYGFIAYAHLSGLLGVGYWSRISSTEEYVVPLVANLPKQRILLAHSYDLNSTNPLASSLKYNATFVLWAEDFSLRQVPIDSPNRTGTVTSGSGNPYVNISIPAFSPGILIVTYEKTGSSDGGLVVMPWGMSALAFPVTFGGNPETQEWVATDMRQVSVGGVSYQAKLALWSYNTQVISR